MALSSSRQFAVITKFTPSHEYVQFDTDTGIAKMGITHHAQKELGDIVHVAMPEVGDKFDKGDSMIAVESVKTAADVFALIDGEVVELNDVLEEEPGTVNASPEKEGWMLKVRVINKEQLDSLMSEEQYKETL